MCNFFLGFNFFVSLGLGSYGSVQNAQIIGHSNPVSSSANSSSQAISSDHCYGLPYQVRKKSRAH